MSNKIPKAESSGFVATLNNMGYMTSGLDSYSSEFVVDALNNDGLSLEIGAAYGLASKEILLGGGKTITNDLDDRHLELFKNSMDKKYHSQMTLKKGDILTDVEFENGTLNAILACRVLHFFDGAQIETLVQKMYNWLEKGGRVYIIAETPYLRNFLPFIPIFEKRKKASEKWPGLVSDVAAIDPIRAQNLPKMMHLLDPDTLTDIFEEKGFLVKKCNTFSRENFPEDIKLDGRESVGLIAEKL